MLIPSCYQYNIVNQMYLVLRTVTSIYLALRSINTGPEETQSILFVIYSLEQFQ